MPDGRRPPYVPLLMSVLGVAWVLGCTIAAEIGDIGWFAGPKRLAGYSARSTADHKVMDHDVAADRPRRVARHDPGRHPHSGQGSSPLHSGHSRIRYRSQALASPGAMRPPASSASEAARGAP